MSRYFSFFFFLSLRYFSEKHTKELFTKRKRNQEISFFLRDPNARVYCYFSAFFFFFLFYCFLFFIFSSFFTWKKNFFKYEFYSICRFAIYAVFIFIWSFFRIDFDLSKSFRAQNFFFGIPEEINFENSIQNRWEFSLYFFQFFGLFYDTYFSFFIFFCCFFFFFNSFFSPYIQKTRAIIFRRVLFIFSFYFFSGETTSYYFIAIFFFSFWFESFLIIYKYLWQLKSWSVIEFSAQIKLKVYSEIVK